MIVILLAGGEGSRIWPLSKSQCPKQFLSFQGHHSLLQRTILRLTKNTNITKILLSINDSHKSLVEKQIREIHKEDICDILSEPLPKNTAPAIAYCMKYLEEIGLAEDPILVLPSDHFMDEEEIFHKHLHLVESQANSTIILFGIKATEPETGYGYIEIDALQSPWTYTIKTFTEKPHLEQAKAYIDQGNYFWNCGIFLWSSAIFWEQMKLHAPDIYALSQGSSEEIRNRYHAFPNISIDYALLEKTQKILLCPLSLTWSDIGSWDNIYKVLKKDESNNAIIGNVEEINTKNSLVINKSKKHVSTIGINNLLIINTEDAVLIVQKGSSQQVKQLKKKHDY
ncbi:MAG: sugar phosphate nucleotidyltransferase [Chlamydiales bacterium]|nr:sugar phosphate nucleotidyltransferase [Chlamydiales bacterium]